MATSDNLAAAFSGESEAHQKYLVFAERAEKEGYPMVAKLFRAAADAEKIHARAHMRVMGTVEGTVENLQGAFDGETREYKEMYPGFISEAKAEGNEAALVSFQNAMAAEQVHASLYLEAMGAVKGGRDLKGGRLYVCSVCGNTVLDAIPEKCPVCDAAAEKFYEVE
jgi:rubrerythrin